MKSLTSQLHRIQKDIDLFFNFAPFVLFSETLGNVLYDFQITYLIISVFIAIGLFVATKIIIQKQLGDLKGSSKLVGLISIGIASGEVIYLGINFGIFNLAIEFIAYLGIGLWVILIPFQTNLKNLASGISNYLNTEIDIGDIIEMDGKKGVIIEFHLTKTILLTESGEKVSIPNHRFHEDILVIAPRTSKNLPTKESEKIQLETSKQKIFKN
ncbi:MAG: mechanosensitive ion channel family protein [Nitrosopumilaceae archaeon]|jgi:small-conductance mechanosensitive channel